MWDRGRALVVGLRASAEVQQKQIGSHLRGGESADCLAHALMMCQELAPFVFHGHFRHHRPQKSDKTAAGPRCWPVEERRGGYKSTSHRTWRRQVYFHGCNV